MSRNPEHPFSLEVEIIHVAISESFDGSFDSIQGVFDGIKCGLEMANQSELTPLEASEKACDPYDPELAGVYWKGRFIGAMAAQSVHESLESRGAY